MGCFIARDKEGRSVEGCARMRRAKGRPNEKDQVLRSMMD